jgi:hypothetical protein
VAARPSTVKGRSNCTPSGLIGSADTAVARSTPGSRLTRSRRSAKNWRFAGLPSYFAGRTMWVATMPEVR